MLNVGQKIRGNHLEVFLFFSRQIFDLGHDFTALKLSFQFFYLHFIALDCLSEIPVFSVDIHPILPASFYAFYQTLHFLQLVPITSFISAQIMLSKEQQVHSIHGVQIFIFGLVDFIQCRHLLSLLQILILIFSKLSQIFSLPFSQIQLPPLFLPEKMFKIIFQAFFNRKVFQPDFRVRSIHDIVHNERILSELKEVKIMIFDKDDTLVPLHEFHVNDPLVSQALSQLKEEGKQIFIVSNSVRQRGKRLTYFAKNEEKGIQLIWTSQKKPFNGQEIQAEMVRRFGPIHPHDITIVGDRLLTDIYLGKISNWKTVLVEPIEPTSIAKHGLGVYLMRKIQSCF